MNTTLCKPGWLSVAVYLFAVTLCLGDVPPSAIIDHLVEKELKELDVEPAPVCSDEVFLRRVYLDLIGTLPTEEEARAFLSDGDAHRRAQLIETLFERPEFADYWALKWGDLLRIKAEFPSRLWPNAVQAYSRWIREAIDTNRPYDRFAYEVLTASGSNFRTAPVNFYRAMAKREPEFIAGTVALTFMGMRTETWPEERLQGMAAFFGQVAYKGTAEWKEEIVFHDPQKRYCYPDTEELIPAVYPDGTPAEIDPGSDPRVRFAEWLVHNRMFSDNIANRIWYWLMGRGPVHEPDDIRPDNPPQSRALLDFLSRELIESGYDLRHIYRIILNSETYQRSVVVPAGHSSIPDHFAFYSIRRLDAEVLIDALCQITQTTESYMSEIPEPFTFIPENQRSIRLTDGSITSPFLDLFGRPSRDTGYESERNSIPSAAQRLHLLNASHIQSKLHNNKVLLGMKSNSNPNRSKKPSGWLPPPEAVERMYLTILSRYPTDAELERTLTYLKDSGLNRYEASVDLVWALINSKEFLFKH